MLEEKSATIAMAADIVAAYVANNTVSANDLPTLIQTVYGALAQVRTGAPAEAAAPQTPAVSIKKSITANYLVCLEDGRQFKSLKRHLSTKFNMSPDDYRAKWGLPQTYPMVAPAYAEARSQLAKKSGLGQMRQLVSKPQPRAKKASATE